MMFSYFPGPATHASARAACQALGGDLASIHSAEENAAAFALTGGKSTRIGLTDAAAEGTFVWDDGTPLDYEAWNSGEPNSYGGDEDCVGYLQGAGDRWHDIRCDVTSDRTDLGYICRSPCPFVTPPFNVDGTTTSTCIAPPDGAAWPEDAGGTGSCAAAWLYERDEEPWVPGATGCLGRANFGCQKCDGNAHPWCEAVDEEGEHAGWCYCSDEDTDEEGKGMTGLLEIDTTPTDEACITLHHDSGDAWGPITGDYTCATSWKYTEATHNSYCDENHGDSYCQKSWQTVYGCGRTLDGSVGNWCEAVDASGEYVGWCDCEPGPTPQPTPGGNLPFSLVASGSWLTSDHFNLFSGYGGDDIVVACLAAAAANDDCGECVALHEDWGGYGQCDCARVGAGCEVRDGADYDSVYRIGGTLATASDDGGSSGGNGANGGADAASAGIIGGAVAGVGVLAAIGVGAFLYMRSKASGADSPPLAEVQLVGSADESALPKAVASAPPIMPPPPPTGRNFCSACGAPIQGSFCSQCGARA